LYKEENLKELTNDLTYLFLYVVISTPRLEQIRAKIISIRSTSDDLARPAQLIAIGNPSTGGRKEECLEIIVRHMLETFPRN
jgi:hypothetical protein